MNHMDRIDTGERTMTTLHISTLPLEVIGLDDAGLARAIEAARASVNAETILERLEAEHQRRVEQNAAKDAERDALLAELTEHRDDYRRIFEQQLAELDHTPPFEAGPLVASAYEMGMRGYSLSHDLAAVTGDRQRFEMRYDVPDQLVLHGGRAAEAFLANQRGRPSTVETPWDADMARLRELMPRVARIGNGG